MEILNFIGGEFTPAQGHKTFAKLSSFDGAKLADVTASEALDVIRALQIAKKSAVLFRETSKEARAHFLLAVAQYLEDHADAIAYEEALHQGLSQDFVLKNSVQVSIKILNEVAQSLLAYHSDDILLQPNGVVGIITAWGCSLRLVIERWAPAFAAGNVCLIKVSEKSPITGKILGNCFHAAKIPPGFVGVLQGDAEIGSLIASHPGIRAITAVGKTSTMENIAKAGLAQFKKLQLSGSAKNAAIVLTDVDFEKSMAEIMAPFLMGQGQLCWNISRIFILESFAPAFIEAAKKYFADLKPLLNPKGREVWTPMISAGAQENIQAKIQEGKMEQGKVISGGENLEAGGFYYRPTLMLDLSNCSVLQQDELQGPLLLVTPVKYQHEAVKWVNTSYLAHSAVVWGLPEKVRKVAGALEVGHVWLNSWLDSSADASPSGDVATIFGHKQSSFGNLEMSWSGSFYSDVKKLAGK